MGTYREEIHRLMSVIEVARAEDPVMPIQMFQTLLAVAGQPGITMHQLGQILNTSQASCSRNVAALGKWHKFGEPGLDFVDAVEDPAERRRKIIFLTAKGRAHVQKLLSAMTGKAITDFETKHSRSFEFSNKAQSAVPLAGWHFKKG
jgi:DNA-binding MarR family transcriptional regulator